MMRRLLSLVSPDNHAVREALTMLCQNLVTLAVSCRQIPRSIVAIDELCQHISKNSYWLVVSPCRLVSWQLHSSRNQLRGHAMQSWPAPLMTTSTTRPSCRLWELAHLRQ